jgi:hypothetical protein
MKFETDVQAMADRTFRHAHEAQWTIRNVCLAHIQATVLTTKNPITAGNFSLIFMFFPFMFSSFHFILRFLSFAVKTGVLAVFDIHKQYC